MDFLIREVEIFFELFLYNVKVFGRFLNDDLKIFKDIEQKSNIFFCF